MRRRVTRRARRLVQLAKLIQAARLMRAARSVQAATGSAHEIVTSGTRRAGTVAKGGWIATAAALEPLAEALEPLMEAARAGTAAGMRSGDGEPVGEPPPAKRGRRMADASSAVRRARRQRAEDGMSATSGSGKRVSLMVASLAAGVAAGAAAALVSRRRRRSYQWQQFEPPAGQSTVDGYGATAVVPVEQPSQPS